MQLGFAHGALEAKQQTIIEGRWIVDALFIEDQCVGVGAQLQQLLPVDGVARQPRDLEPEHDADLAQPHRGDQLLKAVAAGAIRSGTSEILIDHVNALLRPAERQRPFAQRILSSRALTILDDLAWR